MSKANPLWGAPRIHGELLKLGIEISQATVAKYMMRPGKAALANLAHVSGEPRSAVGGNRFSGSEDLELSLAVRICCDESSSATRHSLQRDAASNRRMDGAADR